MPLSTRYGFADAPTSSIIGDGSLGWTTSTGTLAAAGTSLTVASSSAFPAALEFDIVIGVRSATTGVWSSAETRHVTVVSGTTWTVSAGSLSHVSGSDIAHVLTATALKHNPGELTDTGDMPYLLATGRMGRLAAPANGAYSVTWSSGVPSWTAAGSGISFADLATPPTDTALGSSAAPFGAIVSRGLGSDAQFWSYIGTPYADLPSGLASAAVDYAAFVFAYSGTGVNVFGGLELLFNLTDGSGVGLSGVSTVSGSTDQYHAQGTQGIAGNAGSGLLSFATGATGFVQIFGSGNITLGTAFRALNGFNGNGDPTGHVLTQVGLQIDDMTYGSVANYSIRTGTAPSLFGGAVVLPSSTPTIASLNIPHGSAPSSPVNGDIWTTTAGLYVRINGGTVGPLT